MSDLRTRVAAAYDRLGFPSWPDPHPGSASPKDDEYSRVSDPERYRIVAARAHVWTEILGSLPGVEVEALAPGPLDDTGRLGQFDRGVRLTPSAPGALPLLLLERDVPVSTAESPLTVLHVALTQPEVSVQSVPDCGCDACDSGSADLLELVDDTVAQAVGGPLVLLRGRGWHAEWHPDGGSSGSEGSGPDHATMMELCRRLAAGDEVRLPRGAEAYVCRAWF